ncbi:hypothetical protein JYB87_16595 [Shewanella avicenniae]|uniref:Cxxc_20_cxxc protein n=1 Tax=Shewanella avicenniae TaxID=2814294 RepID=A0ABX7QQL8_9GAMM|nr:hypothetical protein [Shewanella avicenniae]QSX33322.1 hypothetical protein JYB87_16595 [Shewanella avicenniae]
MICSHCNKRIHIDKIVEQRGKGFTSQIRCPACGAWLGRSAWLLRIKLLGFYLALAASLVAWWLPDWRPGCIVVAILSVIALFTANLMDQLQVVERPPKVEQHFDR